MRPLPYRIGIHVGLPKCASTSLQLRLEQSVGHNYLGKIVVGRGYRYLDEHLDPLVRERMTYDPESAYEPRQVRETFEQVVSDRGCDPQRLMLSDELLSGFGFLNIPRRRAVDPATIFQRLAALFAEPRLLVIVRSQEAFLRSYYTELLRLGYNVLFDRFLRAQLRSSLGLATLLRYDRYVALARRFFDEVTVVPLEAMVAGDPRAIVALERFGIDAVDLPRANESPSLEALDAQLVKNLEVPTAFGQHTPLDDFGSIEELDRRRERVNDPVFFAPKHLIRQWERLAAESNSTLEGQIDWPLEHLGYAVRPDVSEDPKGTAWAND